MSNVEVFLAGAEAVLAAISHPAVAAAWDQPSVLEEQTVGALAGHVARGGVWIVGEYLESDEPSGPATFDDAAHYLHELVGGADEAVMSAARDRAAAVATAGFDAVVGEARARFAALVPRVRAAGGDRLVATFGGTSMRLDDCLAARVVEQVVHLDDLARSLGREPHPVPAAAVDLALAVALATARRAHGDAAVVRAAYRRGFAADVFPVL